jgi:hypothetical protein
MKATRHPLAAFPFVNPTPPRRLMRSGVPGKGVWEARQEEWDNLRPARQKLILQRLREAFKEGERGLTGWDQMLAWFHEHGFRNREGRPLNERTVRGWSKRLGCPVWRGCRAFAARTGSTPPWTSNYLLLAWAVSLYRSGGADMPRIERPGDAKPAARMPRYSSREPSGMPSALASPTRAMPVPRPEPEPVQRARRFVPPDHGAPPPTRRTVMR